MGDKMNALVAVYLGVYICLGIVIGVWFLFGTFPLIVNIGGLVILLTVAFGAGMVIGSTIDW